MLGVTWRPSSQATTATKVKASIAAKSFATTRSYRTLGSGISSGAGNIGRGRGRSEAELTHAPPRGSRRSGNRLSHIRLHGPRLRIPLAPAARASIMVSSASPYQDASAALHSISLGGTNAMPLTPKMALGSTVSSDR